MSSCTAFLGQKKFAAGSTLDVALKIKERLAGRFDGRLDEDGHSAILVFDDITGRPIDLDLRGNAQAIARRYRSEEGEQSEETERRSGPGRPKLGVVAREVTLLPRHWEWLATQPGGASVTLRKLVEEAKTKNQRKDRVRQAQEATHYFMTAMAGDLPGYEEALRAFYAGKREVFTTLVGAWPRDIREHIRKLAAPLMEDTDV